MQKIRNLYHLQSVNHKKGGFLMGNYSIRDFVNKTQQDQLENDFFELETERVLEVNLNGEVWSKMGAMIAYVGYIKLERERMLEHGM